MKQMRKEHSAVICGNTVYVMGGYDGQQSSFLSLCEKWDVERNKWKPFAPMNIAKCAFSATVVNRKYIYTFGGYDGAKRLDNIERFNLKDEFWELLRLKLKFPLSNCACFSPYINKVVIFGGGFSSGFSHHVEMIDVETGEWKSLPKMKEGRDLRNKVVYVDGSAYAIGGLNKKCERLCVAKRKWQPIDDYIINDNLDSWSCALMFTPCTDFTEMDLNSIQDDDSVGSASPDDADEGMDNYYDPADVPEEAREQSDEENKDADEETQASISTHRK